MWAQVVATAGVGLLQCGLIAWGLRQMGRASEERSRQLDIMEANQREQGQALRQVGQALDRQGQALQQVGQALERQGQALDRHGQRGVQPCGKPITACPPATANWSTERCTA